MRKNLQFTLSVLACLLLALSSTRVQAEVSASSGEFHSYILVMGMTQEPDPITSAIWDQLIPDSDALNSDGGVRLDGPPHIFLSETEVGPVVVWAYNNGQESDIAFSSWNGTAWDEIEFLTSTVDCELDPRIYVNDDGDFFVVYWVKDSDEIRIVKRPAGSPFWSAPEILPSRGRHPSIVIHDDVRLIAFERDGAAGFQEIVVDRLDEGISTLQVIGETSHTGNLNILLHKLGNRIWMDWIHSDYFLGYTQYLNGFWGVSPSNVPWPDHSWIGSEDARRAVRFEILRDE